MTGVQVLLRCGNTAFGGYKQIVCKQGKEILGKFNEANPLSHYMICRMNRLIFREQIIPIDEPHLVEIRFIEQISPTNFEDHSISVPISRNGKSLAVFIKDDNGKILLTAKNGDSIISYPSFTEAMLAIAEEANGDKKYDEDGEVIPPIFPFEFDQLFGLEVLYIGQTEIKDGYLRLDGHEKYAEAADDIIKSAPNKDLYIKFLHFDNPTWFVPETAGEDFNRKMATYRELARSLDAKNWVSFVEAALIQKYQPYLNKHYKRTFPSMSHSTYNFLYDVGIHSAKILVDECLRVYCTKDVDNVASRLIEFDVSLHQFPSDL